MASIKERHLSVGFDPDLIACMLGKDWECSDMQAELEGLGKFAWEVLIWFSLVFRWGAPYQDRYPEIATYLLILRSPDSQGIVARSSIETGEDGKRNGLHWACCPAVQ
jgi:hypothetical protein